MRKGFLLILLILAALSVACVLPVKAQLAQTMHINTDGSVTPSGSAIDRVGSTYTLTADLSSPIMVEANNIVLDGAGYTLSGPSTSVLVNSIGVNLTAANVTVQNMHVSNWGVGVLGAWNNNTVENNVFTGNNEAVVIYGDTYVIRQNSITNSTTGLFIDGGFQPQGDNILITQNQITENSQAFDVTNNNMATITGNNVADNGLILLLATNTAGTLLYYNNFTNNQQVLTIPFGGPTVEGIVPFSPAGQWDNGSVGNYWSDYTTRYPDAAEIGHTGIGNTAYVIVSTVSYTEGDISGVAVLGNAADNYPLMAPATVLIQPSPNASPAASPAVPEYPTSTFLMVLLVTACSAALLIFKRQAKKVKSQV